MFRRLFVIVSSLVLFSTFAVVQSGSAMAASSAPQCRNYVSYAPWGRLAIDIRPHGADPIGTVSWAMFINEVADIPGEYEYLEFVNGKPISKVKRQFKDDNIHAVFYRVENGKVRYGRGDEIHIFVRHQANGHIYITPLNRCRVL